MDVFQYLPNFARDSSIEFSVPFSVHSSDQNKQQRYTTSHVKSTTYNTTETYYEIDSIRSYTATYSSIANITDSTIINRLRGLRDNKIYLPFYLEPLEVTGNLAGQTVATLDTTIERSIAQLKFLSDYVLRLDIQDREFFEYRQVASSKQTMLENDQITVSSPWTASIPASRTRLFFLDTVYMTKLIPSSHDTDQVSHLQVGWMSA